MQRVTDPAHRARVLITVMDPTQIVHPTLNAIIVRLLDKGYSMDSIANTCLGEPHALVKTNLTREEQIPEMMARLRVELNEVHRS